MFLANALPISFAFIAKEYYIGMMVMKEKMLFLFILHKSFMFFIVFVAIIVAFFYIFRNIL